MKSFYFSSIEIMLIIFFILLVFIEYYLILLGFIYIALFDGIIAFLIGIYTLKIVIKKIKINRR